MNKYRGVRGIRDYAREARELILPALFLAGMCLGVFVLLMGLFYINRQREVEVVAVFLEQAIQVDNSSVLGLYETEEPSPFLAEDMLPIVPLSWSEEIFFDAHSGKIIFPHEFNATVEYIYYKRRHTVTFEGAEFTRKFLSLSQYNIVPMHIWREGDSITFFSGRGAFVEYGENDSYSYIKLVDPREIYHTIVIVDAGHGGHDTGAPSVYGRNAPFEAEINLAVTQRLLEIFDEPGVLLIPTRTDNYFLSPPSRTGIANSIGDYFISIHCNADNRSSRSRGTLTLYGTAEGSHELAEKFNNALVATLESQDRGIHYASEFRILRESNIPVILLELLFLSNPEDATRLAQPQTQMLIAETLAETIKNLPRVR